MSFIRLNWEGSSLLDLVKRASSGASYVATKGGGAWIYHVAVFEIHKGRNHMICI